MRTLARLAALVVATSVSVSIPPGGAASAELGVIRYAGVADTIKDSYLVVFKDAAGVDRKVSATTARHGGTVRHTFRSALAGYAATMSEQTARRVAADPSVAYVQQDRMVHALADQLNPPSWGLDRIDQPDRPLDGRYTFAAMATTVHAYVIDSGIRLTHQDFGGRATWGVNTTGDGNNTDCNGHGTHVAGTVGGGTYGVAKGVRLVAVKVLNCAGSATTAGVLAGIDWVTANAVRPAVAVLSIGGTANPALDDAVRRSIASGVTYVVASGNNSANACNFSPARVPEAITVNASDPLDNRASFSNFGSCTDMFAPGVNITSTWGNSDTGTNTISGTSMAAAHVAGMVAQWLAVRPNILAMTVKDLVVSQSALGRLLNIGAGSPNVIALAARLQIALWRGSAEVPGWYNEDFRYQLTALGGRGARTWTASGLPPGLTLNPATGEITGVPTQNGRYPVTLIVQDESSPRQSDTATVTFRISSRIPVVDQLVNFPTFGPRPDPWTATTGVLGQTLQPGREDSWSAWLGGTGFAHTDQLSQTVTLPAGHTSYVLSFWAHIETLEQLTTGPQPVPWKPGPVPYVKPQPVPYLGPYPEPWDWMEISLDGPHPEPWTVLGVFRDVDAAAGFQQWSFDLTQFAGQTLTLRFTAHEDNGSLTTFVIDDVELNLR